MHQCNENRDRGAGFVCAVGFCAPRCETTADCEAGRACESVDPSTPTSYLFLCDEMVCL